MKVTQETEILTTDEKGEHGWKGEFLFRLIRVLRAIRGKNFP